MMFFRNIISKPPVPPRKKTISGVGLTVFLGLTAAVGAPATLQHEGIRLIPYYDSVGIRTVCAGETAAAHVSKASYTIGECKHLFGVQYGFYSKATAEMYSLKAKDHVTPEIHAAFTDMSYNVGLAAVRKSSMIKFANQGKMKEACEAIKKYKYVTKNGKKIDCSQPGNKICSGIWTRRLHIYDLCMKGI